jgi:hypothetical protein
VKHGKCKLCLKDKPLCESHLIPESLYAHIREGKESPMRVGDRVVMTTDRHMTTYLLCSKCEDILSKSGETWLAPKLAWVDGRFPLFDLLQAAGGFSAAEEGEGLFYARDNPEIDAEKIAHFAVGIFWKASVHSWKGDKSERMITLGPEQEEIRLWLRGEGPFPTDVALNLSVSRPGRTLLVLQQPVQVPVRRRWRAYNCHLVGAFFSLKAGDIAIEDRMFCFYRNPARIVLCSDKTAGIWNRKVFEQFDESRKTKSYLKSKDKRKKMPVQKCPMCLETKNVVSSHLIPARVYEYLHATGTQPISISSKVVMETGRQLQDYLLCLECEDRLNKGGEMWLLPLFATYEGSFPFYDLLTKVPPEASFDIGAAYFAAKNPAIQVDKIIHFGAFVGGEEERTNDRIGSVS